MADHSPVRVVLDARLRVPLATSVIGTARETPTWVVADRAASPLAEEILRAKGVEVVRIDAQDGRFDLGSILKMLAERGITRLMVEGGPTVAASFVRADLVDEAALFRSAKPIGAGGIDALEGLPLTALTQSTALKPVASEAVGGDTVDLFERS
jgi:diaminohydroxyphosphoribosylaminopyrimidine deaminase/5-amino-6-(5-phosphoribosylamino)uracil reductase